MDLKLKAHIGDALAAFFARTLINEAIGPRSRHYQSSHYVHCNRMVSNEHFTKTCQRFHLFDIDETKVTYFNHRTYGTLYESHLYELYISEGIDKAADFFKQTAYKLYTELYEEIPIL